MAGVYFEKGKNYNIQDEKEVKVTKLKAQNKAEVTSTSIRKTVIDKFKKISANECVDTVTGEVKEYKKNVIKPEKAVKRSMRKLEKILMNNFAGEDDEFFITLTTEEEVKDINKIKRYAKDFVKNLKRIYGSGFKYAYVFEMHALRDSWHIHMIVKGTKGIQNNIVKKNWKAGLTRTTRVTDKDTEFEINEEKAMNEPNGFWGQKSNYGIEKVISYMSKYKSKECLPSKIRAFSISKNLEKPVETKMTYREFKEECNNYSKKEEYTTLIRSNETDKIINRIKKERWKKLRKE